MTMTTLKREWLKVADIPGAPFRGTYKVKVDHVLSGSNKGGRPKENPRPRWAGKGRAWTDVDINHVEVEGAWVWCQSWTKCACGWGQQNDGYTLHAEKDHIQLFLKAMRAQEQKGYVPAYLVLECSPYRCFITDSEVLSLIEKSKHGVGPSSGRQQRPRREPADDLG